MTLVIGVTCFMGRRIQSLVGDSVRDRSLSRTPLLKSIDLVADFPGRRMAIRQNRTRI